MFASFDGIFANFCEQCLRSILRLLKLGPAFVNLLERYVRPPICSRIRDFESGRERKEDRLVHFLKSVHHVLK